MVVERFAIHDVLGVEIPLPLPSQRYVPRILLAFPLTKRLLYTYDIDWCSSHRRYTVPEGNRETGFSLLRSSIS